MYKKIFEAIFILGIGPLFKFAGTVYLGALQKEDTIFATIWALDAFTAFILSISFFSSDLYLTRVLRDHNTEEQRNIFWNIFFFTIFISVSFAIPIAFWGYVFAESIINIKSLTQSLLFLAFASTITLNIFRLLFASLRILNIRIGLLYLSFSYYFFQFVSFVLLVNKQIDVIYSFYFSYIIPSIVLIVFSLYFFGVPSPREILKDESISKYWNFVKKNWMVEPGSSFLVLIERVLIANIFAANVVNIYAQASKIIEPISMAGKLSKFIFIGPIVSFARFPHVEKYSKKLVRVRSYLLYSLTVVCIIYPIISFAEIIAKVNFPSYEILFWLSSIYIVGILSFFYSTGFFSQSDFSKTTVIDLLSVFAASLVFYNSSHPSLITLACGVSLKVGVNFGMRVLFSSKIQGHLSSSKNEILIVYGLLFVPILILVHDKF